jgi:alanine racemase
LEFSNETILHIDLNKLEQNFNYLKSKLKKNTRIIGVVKAFAYGHGDIEISRKLEKLGAYALWVSDFEEGISLRKAGIKSKIIVANPGLKSYEEIIKYSLDIVIYNQRLLDLYASKKNEINIKMLIVKRVRLLSGIPR